MCSPPGVLQPSPHRDRTTAARDPAQPRKGPLPLLRPADLRPGARRPLDRPPLPAPVLPPDRPPPDHLRLAAHPAGTQPETKNPPSPRQTAPPTPPRRRNPSRSLNPPARPVEVGGLRRLPLLLLLRRRRREREKRGPGRATKPCPVLVLVGGGVRKSL